MKKLLLISILAGSLFASTMPESYKSCVVCHGGNGEKVALSKSKVLKDMTKEEIENALKGYQNGTYGGAMKGVMLGQAKRLSDKDIEEISIYLNK